MPTLDVKKLQENITKSVQKVLLAQTQAVNEGMLELEADLKERIFLNGNDNAGGKIGSYSTSPIYVSIEGAKKRYGSQIATGNLKPRGKKKGDIGAERGSKNKKVINKFRQVGVNADRLSMYMPGGYKEFRSVVGALTDTVNLRLTGSLQGDIKTGGTENGVILSFTNDDKAEIAGAQEKRFGKTIFAASEQEISKLVDGWEDAVTKAFYASFE
jgi:hypothetical protein